MTIQQYGKIKQYFLKTCSSFTIFKYIEPKNYIFGQYMLKSKFLGAYISNFL